MISTVEITESNNQSERLQPDRQCESGRLHHRDTFVHHLVCLVAAVSLSDLVAWARGERMSSLSIFVLGDEALIRLMIIQMVEDLGHHVAAEAGSTKATYRAVII
jgi:hypothetical protein